MQVVWLLEEIWDCVVVAGEVRGRLATADVAADVVVDGEMGDCAHAWETLVAIATAEKSVVIDQPEPAGVGSHTRRQGRPLLSFSLLNFCRYNNRYKTYPQCL